MNGDSGASRGLSPTKIIALVCGVAFDFFWRRQVSPRWQIVGESCGQSYRKPSEPWGKREPWSVELPLRVPAPEFGSRSMLEVAAGGERKAAVVGGFGYGESGMAAPEIGLSAP